MPKAEPVTNCDFFINTAALESGLTQQFWYQAYLQFLKDTESDTTMPGFEMYDIARTVRVPFGQRHFDILVRCQPDPREYRIIRLTAFPAGDEKLPYWMPASDGSAHDSSLLSDRNISSFF